MCWQSKRLHWEGHLGKEQQGKGTQENCSATWLTVSGFMIMELISGLCLADRLAWPVVSLRVLPGGTCISQPRWTVRRSLEGWCSPPSFGLSSVLPVTLQWQHPVPYQDLLLLDTSGKWAWSRWVVSINSSLTQPPSTSHGSGSNESDGEWQMKLSSLASRSPPAVRLSS